MHPQGSQNEATKDKGHLEVLAKDLIILHQVFRLRAAGNIVKNCPERKINIKQLLSSIFAYREMFRGGYFWAKVTKRLVPICRVQGGEIFGH